MAKTRFHAMLEARIQEVIVDRMESLSRGTAKNYDEYKYYVGSLDGLRDVLKICDELEKEFN